MEGIPWASWAGNIILLGVAVFIIRSYVLGVKEDVISVKNDIKELIAAQVKSCDKRLKTIEAVDTDQWSVINSHGHKGLDENNSRVTR